MMLGGNMVLCSVIFLLGLSSFGSSLVKLFVVLFMVTMFVSLELGIGGSGLLGLIFFLTYASGMLVLFLYMFCLFSKTFKFSKVSWNWSVLSGLMLCSFVLFSLMKKEQIWEDTGDGLGVFLDSESLFVGGFFTSLFMLALWVVFKMLCLKNGCLRPFF